MLQRRRFWDDGCRKEDSLTTMKARVLLQEGCPIETNRLQGQKPPAKGNSGLLCGRNSIIGKLQGRVEGIPETNTVDREHKKWLLVKVCHQDTSSLCVMYRYRKIASISHMVLLACCLLQEPAELPDGLRAHALCVLSFYSPLSTVCASRKTTGFLGFLYFVLTAKLETKSGALLRQTP